MLLLCRKSLDFGTYIAPINISILACVWRGGEGGGGGGGGGGGRVVNSEHGEYNI